jgi:hypothetical protein
MKKKNVHFTLQGTELAVSGSWVKLRFHRVKPCSAGSSPACSGYPALHYNNCILFFPMALSGQLQTGKIFGERIEPVHDKTVPDRVFCNEWNVWATASIL